MTLIKKTDKIVLFPFLRLFILVLFVTLFIILMQFILVWFDELINKNLGFWIYLQLLFYFGINATPAAFPLATLVASIMVLGNLGERLELTGLKTAGISFLKIIRSLFIAVAFLSLLSYASNSYLVPKVNVKAYNLLYDLRKTKPSIAIKEGVFYNGVPGYSIRVEKKLPDQKTMQNIIIYKHDKNTPNLNVTVASSGRLSNIQNGKYLVIELFDGHTYVEEIPKKTPDQEANAINIPNLYRASFKHQRVLINLDSFKISHTSQDYFTYHHTTKNNLELDKELDSLNMVSINEQKKIMTIFEKHYAQSFTVIKDTLITSPSPNILPDHPNDLVNNNTSLQIEPGQIPLTYNPIFNKTNIMVTLNAIKTKPTYPNRQHIISTALESAKKLKKLSQLKELQEVAKNLRILQVERSKRASYALGCLLMLMVGASLGALIKKGGFGFPLLISTVFIVLYYVSDIFAVKWAKSGLFHPLVGAWASNFTLLPFATFFLLQAQKDTNLLDYDAYLMKLRKIKQYLIPKKDPN